MTISSSPWRRDSSHQAQTTRFTKIKTAAERWKFTLHVDFKGNIRSQTLGWGMYFEPQPARSPPEGPAHAAGVYAGLVTKFGLNVDGELCSWTWIWEHLILAQQLWQRLGFIFEHTFFLALMKHLIHFSSLWLCQSRTPGPPWLFRVSILKKTPHKCWRVLGVPGHSEMPEVLS